MEPMSPECLRKHRAQSSIHIAASVVRHERIVSKITGAEQPSHDLIDVDNAGKFPSLGANPVADMSRASEALEVIAKGFVGPWWRSPVPVKVTASSHGIEKLVPSSR